MKYLLFSVLICLCITGCTNFPKGSEKFFGEWKETNVPADSAHTIIVTSAGSSEIQVFIPKRKNVKNDKRQLFKNVQYNAEKHTLYNSSNPNIEIALLPGEKSISLSVEGDAQAGPFQFVNK